MSAISAASICIVGAVLNMYSPALVNFGSELVSPNCTSLPRS